MRRSSNQHVFSNSTVRLSHFCCWFADTFSTKSPLRLENLQRQFSMTPHQSRAKTVSISMFLHRQQNHLLVVIPSCFGYTVAACNSVTPANQHMMGPTLRLSKMLLLLHRIIDQTVREPLPNLQSKKPEYWPIDTSQFLDSQIPHNCQSQVKIWGF